MSRNIFSEEFIYEELILIWLYTDKNFFFKVLSTQSLRSALLVKGNDSLHTFSFPVVVQINGG